MLKVILERDQEVIETSQFKFNGPYIKIVEGALKRVQEDLKATNIYARRNKIQVIKKVIDGDFTEFIFMYADYRSERRYSNLRLRNRTEELLQHYLQRGSNINGQNW